MSAAAVVVGLALAVALLLRRRSATKDRRAGLVAVRPQFFAEPPLRRHHDRRKEAL